MCLEMVSWFPRYQGQCRALRPLGHQGYRLRTHMKDQPLHSGYIRSKCTLIKQSCKEKRLQRQVQGANKKSSI